MRRYTRVSARMYDVYTCTYVRGVAFSKGGKCMKEVARGQKRERNAEVRVTVPNIA